jgi:hypothetical protein
MAFARLYDTLWERVMSKVVLLDGQNENGCWIFTGRLDKDGYGRLNTRIDGKHVTKRAHQVVWEEIEKRPLPEGFTLDHSVACIGKACCNYDHVELVTRAVNSQRSQANNPRRPTRPEKRNA